ncbi:MAG: nicotinate-nucleotide adenylyltransferase [Myxococcota bacterium]|nr:nicotinate-nucleotide adenylyltransferase [Myxococcota bacterium]
MTASLAEDAALARTGVYGGTFNPIHLGHLRAAEEVADALGLTRVLFVPSAEPPHKAQGARDPLAPAAQRLAWVRAAVADNPRFEADDLEIARGGASYSVDTLRALAERLAPERPVFLIGHDAFVEIGSWREPETLFELAHFAVTTRPPVQAGRLPEWIPAGVRGAFELSPDGHLGRHRGAGTWVRLVEIAALDVSASDIRARVRDGRSVRYLVPESIREAVLESGVYAAT